MASGAMETLLDHVCQLASLPTRNETSSELLHRFVTYQDELAFNTLVQKYGRLVISVARQILCHEQDAEDAFQATFLILSRRAESIRNAESIASWLYGVAYRVSVRIKESNVRRSTTLNQEEISEENTVEGEVLSRELQSALHEELSRLPEKLREPFVLCCLEGRTRREAAHDLGWKEGTVSGRLARARKQLQSRLTRRGFQTSAVLTVLDLSSARAETLPTALPDFSLISDRVTLFADEVMKAMTKSRMSIVILFTLLFLGLSSYIPLPPVARATKKKKKKTRRFKSSPTLESLSTPRASQSSEQRSRPGTVCAEDRVRHKNGRGLHARADFSSR